jgi:hypothetical protein
MQIKFRVTTVLNFLAIVLFLLTIYLNFSIPIGYLQSIQQNPPTLWPYEVKPFSTVNNVWFEIGQEDIERYTALSPIVVPLIATYAFIIASTFTYVSFITLKLLASLKDEQQVNSAIARKLRLAALSITLGGFMIGLGAINGPELLSELSPLFIGSANLGIVWDSLIYGYAVVAVFQLTLLLLVSAQLMDKAMSLKEENSLTV